MSDVERLVLMHHERGLELHERHPYTPDRGGHSEGSRGEARALTHPQQIYTRLQPLLTDLMRRFATTACAKATLSLSEPPFGRRTQSEDLWSAKLQPRGEPIKYKTVLASFN